MTNIEWTDKSWNPIVGCSKVSAGCVNCYAINQAYRNWQMAKNLEKQKQGRLAYYQYLTTKNNSNLKWTGIIYFVEEALKIPLRRRKPTRFFVNSMSDLFHESAQTEWIDKIFAIMALCPQHTFQILTKRADRMAEYFAKNPQERWVPLIWEFADSPCLGHLIEDLEQGKTLSNVWLGVSVENNAACDRIPYLIDTPAEIKFLSCEPLLEEIEFSWEEKQKEIYTGGGWVPDDRQLCGNYLSDIDWVIVGGESGSRSRPCQISWIEKIVEQCLCFNVPVFVKQLGTNNNNNIKTKNRKGGDFDNFPEFLKIRQFPNKR